MNYYQILKPFIFSLPAETAHNLAIWALKHSLLPSQKLGNDNESIKNNVFGIDFKNPIGLAAGFDKNADAICSLSRQGFGFVEAGTVTPQPQEGNAKPRLFRLKEDEAVINRFGFNNKGADYFIKNLQKKLPGSIVGANIGKNKTSEDATADYIYLLERIYGLSDYITINISSPNTPGLRDLQSKKFLDSFLGSITDKARELEQKTAKKIPLLLKLAPDTDITQREEIAQIVSFYKIDGLIISNTTIGERDKLKSKHANEQGGLSGRPLFNESTDMIKDMYRLTNGNIPIVGVGGVFSAEDAYKKIKSGASLVQIYSALVYKGFPLINDITSKLPDLLKKDGFSHISQAIGVEKR